MAKYRIISRGSLVTVKSRLALGEQINERELELFGTQLFRGFFRPRQEGKRTMIYTAPDVMELGKFLRQPLDEETFYGIAAQAVEKVKQIEMNGLYIGNLILSMNMVFIRERTKEVFFIYQPLISRYMSGNIYAFVGDVMQAAIKTQGAGTDFLEEFQSFLKDTGNYRTEAIEGHIKKVCPQVYQKIVTADMGNSGFITSDRLSYEQHYQKVPDNEFGTILLAQDEGTTLLTEDAGTTLLASEEKFPILTRLKTGEQIPVRQNCFLIGKDAGCDYSITDNRVISRRHAIIEKKNGVYFIVDENSTNHTYLNGQLLEGGKSYELADKMTIRMADEEFKFDW